MTEVVVVIGPGSIGQVRAARRLRTHPGRHASELTKRRQPVDRCHASASENWMTWRIASPRASASKPALISDSGM